MTNQTNRHLLVYTVVNASTGRTYDMQDDPRDAVTCSALDAPLRLASRQAALAARTRSFDGFKHELTYSNFRIHSWYARPAAEVMASFAPPPMSGPENDQAWIDGPGSDAL